METTPRVLVLAAILFMAATMSALSWNPLCYDHVAATAVRRTAARLALRGRARGRNRQRMSFGAQQRTSPPKSTAAESRGQRAESITAESTAVGNRTHGY